VETKKGKYDMVLFIPLNVYVWLSTYTRNNSNSVFYGFTKCWKINVNYLVKLGSTSLTISGKYDFCVIVSWESRRQSTVFMNRKDGKCAVSHDPCVCFSRTLANIEKWKDWNLNWVLLIKGPITAFEGWTRSILIPANTNKWERNL
jgi:hypothetical protein